jgi:N-acetylglucosaminyldiphosphoundecaprenol N-acetyl-beta-D-mannosaminyltransferase
MSLKKNNRSGRFPIGKVFVSEAKFDDVMDDVIDSTAGGRAGYICFMDTRTAYLANHDAEYCSIQNNSMYTFPDGILVVLYARNSGHPGVVKLSGKDFMDKVFSLSVRKGLSHFFFGSTQETIDKLQENLHAQYPGIVIKGAVSPPFQPLESFDIEKLANELNTLRPSFFWCGLGAPKQERLMALLQPRLDATVCAGVGLAFEYLAGTVTRAPEWMHRNGLEWVYRLAQQPHNIRRVVRPVLWILRELFMNTMRRK